MFCPAAAAGFSLTHASPSLLARRQPLGHPAASRCLLADESSSCGQAMLAPLLSLALPLALTTVSVVSAVGEDAYWSALAGGPDAASESEWDDGDPDHLWPNRYWEALHGHNRCIPGAPFLGHFHLTFCPRFSPHFAHILAHTFLIFELNFCSRVRSDFFGSCVPMELMSRICEWNRQADTGIWDALGRDRLSALLRGEHGLAADDVALARISMDEPEEGWNLMAQPAMESAKVPEGAGILCEMAAQWCRYSESLPCAKGDGFSQEGDL